MREHTDDDKQGAGGVSGLHGGRSELRPQSLLRQHVQRRVENSPANRINRISGGFQAKSANYPVQTNRSPQVEISQPGDTAEIEADSVANQVMRAPSAANAAPPPPEINQKAANLSRFIQKINDPDKKQETSSDTSPKDTKQSEESPGTENNQNNNPNDLNIGNQTLGNNPGTSGTDENTDPNTNENLPIKTEKKVKQDEVKVNTGSEKLKPGDDSLNRSLNKVDPIKQVNQTEKLDGIDPGKTEEKKGDQPEDLKALNKAKDSALPPLGGDSKSKDPADQTPQASMAGVSSSLENLKTQPIQFKQPDTEKLPKRKAESINGKYELSNQLANEFLNQRILQVQKLLQRSQTITPILAESGNAAKNQIDGSVKSETKRIEEYIGNLKSGAIKTADDGLNKINTDYITRKSDIETRAATSRNKINTAYQNGLKSLQIKMGNQYPKIDQIYTNGAQALKQTGIDMGKAAFDNRRAHIKKLMDPVTPKKDDNWHDGPYKHNKAKARADVAEKYAISYKEGLAKEGEKQANQLLNGPGKSNDYQSIRDKGELAKASLKAHYETVLKAVNTSEQRTLENLKKAKETFEKTIKDIKTTTLDLLSKQYSAQAGMLTAFGKRQKDAIDRDLKKAAESIKSGIVDAAQKLVIELNDFRTGAHSADTPDPVALKEVLLTSRSKFNATILSVHDKITTSHNNAKSSLLKGGEIAALVGVVELNNKGIQEAKDINDDFDLIVSNSIKNANTSFGEIDGNHKKNDTETTPIALKGFASWEKSVDDIYKNFLEALKKGLEDNNKAFKAGLQDVIDNKMTQDCEKEEVEAEKKVKPRWQKVLIAIVVVIVVVAISLVLGPLVAGIAAGLAAGLGVGATATAILTAVFTIVGYGLVGAVASAAGQIVGNVLNGEKWHQDLGKALLSGFLGGLIGGAGGVLAQAITRGASSIVVPALIRFGLKFTFDAGGTIIGDLATGKLTPESAIQALAISAIVNLVGLRADIRQARGIPVSKGIFGFSQRLENFGNRLGRNLGGHIRSNFRPNVDVPAPSTRTTVDTPETTKLNDSPESNQRIETTETTQTTDIGDNVKTTETDLPANQQKLLEGPEPRKLLEGPENVKSTDTNSRLDETTSQNRLDETNQNLTKDIDSGTSSTQNIDSQAIETPYGMANQSSSPDALAARTEVKQGAILYRTGTMGKSQAAEAQFWSLEHPHSPGFAQKYGIPPENIQNANFIETAILKPGTPFITRNAPGFGGNPGGGIEVVVPVGGIEMQSFNTL